MSVHHVYTVPSEARRGNQILWNWRVLLTTEPSFQTFSAMFPRNRKINLTICMKPKIILNSQINLEEKE